jgi:hypothetical protein
MKIELKEEHEDGSATFNVNYSPEELQSMIQFALVRMLEESLTRMEDDHFNGDRSNES